MSVTSVLTLPNVLTDKYDRRPKGDLGYSKHARMANEGTGMNSRDESNQVGFGTKAESTVKVYTSLKYLEKAAGPKRFRYVVVLRFAQLFAVTMLA